MPDLSNTRRSFNTSNARLRRARRLYASLVRRWVERARTSERFRARLWIVAERAVESGLYAPTTGTRLAMFGLLSKWRDADRMQWWPWMHADKRRASVADWSIRSVSIKLDAEKERRHA